MPVAFIPARGGSKSIPRKNVKDLGGKPLIVWSIQTAIDCGIPRVIVNTDDEEIADVSRNAGAEVMMRSEGLGEDTTSMFDLLKSEVPLIGADCVLLLQPTTPFRKKTHIKTALATFSANDYDSLISVERVPEKYNPAQVIITTPAGLTMANGAPIAQRLTRRQSFPESFIPTGSIYLFRSENLKHGSMYGARVQLLETEGTININTLEDFTDAEQWLASSQK